MIHVPFVNITEYLQYNNKLYLHVTMFKQPMKSWYIQFSKNYVTLFCTFTKRERKRKIERKQSEGSPLSRRGC